MQSNHFACWQRAMNNISAFSTVRHFVRRHLVKKENLRLRKRLVSGRAWNRRRLCFASHARYRRAGKKDNRQMATVQPRYECAA